MTLFSYNNDIPATNNNPSSDQPKMLENTQSINDLLAVNHYTFNTNTGGEHIKINYTTAPNYIPDPTTSAPVGNNSLGYTQAGTESSAAELLFLNSNNTPFHCSAIKAFGVFTTIGTTNPITPDLQSNVASINYDTVTQAVTINLVPNAVNGTKVAVFINAGSGTTPGWTFAANTLTLAIVTPASAGRKISFAILQT